MGAVKLFPRRFCWLIAQAFCYLVLSYSAAAQVSVTPEEVAKKEAGRRVARQLIEAALAQSKDLRLDENHIVVESKAAEVLWMLDPQQARALLRNVLARLDDEDFNESSDPGIRQRRLGLRQRILQTTAAYDPQFALDTLSKDGNQGPEAAQYRRQMELDLASRVASQEPARALGLAQKNIGDVIPPQFASIISSLWSNNPQAAATLAQSVVAALGRGSAEDRQQNIYAAFNLLATLAYIEESAQSRRQDGRSPPPSLLASAQTAADFLATQALESDNRELVFRQLLYGSDQLEKYAPAKFARLKARMSEWKQQHPEIVSNMEFNKIAANSNIDEQLAAAASAPPQNRDQFFNQIAWNVLGKGDYERARGIISQNVSPEQRSQGLAELSRQAAWQAASKGNFDAARTLALDGARTAEERATVIAQLVISAGEKISKGQAVGMLEEAAGMLGSPPRTASELNALLQVAGVFAAFDDRRAVEMLESAGERINEVVNSLAQIDGFLPFSRSFENGELLLETGYASNSLVAAYASAAAAIASHDPENAKALATKLQRSEARVQVYLEISQGLASSARDRTVILRTGVGGSVGSVRVQ